MTDTPATTSSNAIRNVSDTALWVAIYRAMESERPDAIFRDPYARRLGGERGETIVRQMPNGAAMAWPMIVRTAVMDEIVRAKPSGAKGKYIRSATVATTMGPGVRVDTSGKGADRELAVAASSAE